MKWNSGDRAFIIPDRMSCEVDRAVGDYHIAVWVPYKNFVLSDYRIVGKIQLDTEENVYRK